MSSNGGISGATVGDWADRAACINHPQREVFFNADHSSQEAMAAKQICAMCPVRRECLEHALRFEKFFVWGGYTAKERRRMKRQRSRR